MATTLTNSGLKIQDAYGESQWFQDYQDNWNRLHDTLLKYSALLDVDVTGISTGDVLQWNSSSSKWEPYTPTHNPTGAAKTSTTTSTTTTTTTTTIWWETFEYENFTQPSKKHWQIGNTGADEFSIFENTMRAYSSSGVAGKVSLLSRFKLVGDPLEVHCAFDWVDAGHPSGGNNWALALNFYNYDKTKMVGVGGAFNYYGGYRTYYVAMSDASVNPPTIEEGDYTPGMVHDAPWVLRLYKSGTSIWCSYRLTGAWEFEEDPLSYLLDDEWFAGPVWVELFGWRPLTGGIADVRWRTFTVVKGDMVFSSTTTTTTTATVTTTTQTVPVYDDIWDDGVYLSASITLSGDKKTAYKHASSGSSRITRSKNYARPGMPEGSRFYCEVDMIASEANSRYYVGVCSEQCLNTDYPGKAGSDGYGYFGYDGRFTPHEGSASGLGVGGDMFDMTGLLTIQMAVDVTLLHEGMGIVWFGFDDDWDIHTLHTASPYDTVPYRRPHGYRCQGDRLYIACGHYYTGDTRSWKLKMDSASWTYTPPTGFVEFPNNAT